MVSFFENLKKFFLEEWRTLENRIFESHAFNLLKEKYQSLNLFHQKLIKYSCLCLVFCLLAYLPFSYFLSSRGYWKDFKEHQELSMELSKMRNKISGSLFHFSQKQLKKHIESSIKKYSNEEFQIEEKKVPIPKKSVYQIDFDIQVKHINVKQVFRLGTELSGISQSRLKSIVMEESAKYPKHYDVIYALSSFFSKEQTGSMERKRKTNRKKRARKRNKRSKRRKPDIQERGVKPEIKGIKTKEESKKRDRIKKKEKEKKKEKTNFPKDNSLLIDEA